jgi:DNA-binding PadR family transcriptional regulator
MRLIDVLDTDDTRYAPMREARIAWLNARATYERTGEGREAVERAMRNWQDVSLEMRPEGRSPE